MEPLAGARPAPLVAPAPELSAAAAAVEGIRARRDEATGVAALQEYHRT